MTKRTRLFIDIIIFGLVICIFFFSYTIYKGYEDVSGVIIGKSEEVCSNRKSTKVYTDYVFAIHSDDKRLSDFDIEVPLCSYVKFNVGDKVVFRDVDIYSKLEDPSWYQDQILCRVLIMLLTWVTVVCLMCSLYYKQ